MNARASPRLARRSSSRSRIAGCTETSNADNALAFVISPAVGTALYGLSPQYPYVASTLLAALLCVFVLAHPGVRQAASGARGAGYEAEGSPSPTG